MSRKYFSLIMLFVSTCTITFADILPAYKEKYADVLDHYSHNEADSIKYRAAMYLIENMDGHVSPEGTPINNYISQVRMLKKGRGIKQLQTVWNDVKKTGSVNYVPDSAVISCSYLLDNIENAFEAWNNAAWKELVSFESFCKYILPYRINDEHISMSWRDLLKKRYESLIDGVPELNKAFAIIKDTVFKDVVLSNDYCPYTLDPITCLNIGKAECGQRCILLVAALRALGIPAAIDITPMWADYSNKGHAWVAVILDNGATYTVYENDDEAKQFNPVDASKFINRYKIKEEDKCPYDVKTCKTPVKIYRICFEKENEVDKNVPGILANPFVKDVSSKYGLESDVSIDANNSRVVYLCSYLSAKDWMPVARAKAEDEKVVFQNVGSGSVCVPIYMENGVPRVLSCPFLVGENGIQKYFLPSEEKQKVIVDRKYPLCSYTTDTWGFMRGATFEASIDEDFEEKDTIGMIETMPFGVTTIELKPPTKKYRFLRYHAPRNNRSSLSELQFYAISDSGESQLLRGSFFSSGVDSSMVDRLFDNSFSTICKGLDVGYTVGIDLGEGNEKMVSKIVFCPSTDLNFIEKGHLYELYYYDTIWHLIGRVYSKGEKITFHNVPKGSLLLLKDKTGGVEERVFEYENGKQIWH